MQMFRWRMTIVGLGSISLGLLIGGIVDYFIAKQPHFDDRGLGAAVSALVGAGVIGIFQALRDKDVPQDRQIWLYPVGLLLGCLAMSILVKNGFY
jgi:hypothetical protein